MSKRRSRRMAGALVCALAAGVLGGCSDDAPDKPRTGAVVRVPEDAATLHAALELATLSDTIRVGPGTHMTDSTLVFDVGHVGVTLIGRAESEQRPDGAARPVIMVASQGGTVGIVVRPGVLGVTIRGVEIRGNIRDGVHLFAPGARLVDCRIEAADRYAVHFDSLGSLGTVENCLLVAPGRFGVNVQRGASPFVIGNTIIGSLDCGIATFNSSPTCERNLIYDSVNFGIFCDGTPPALACNLLFRNTIPYSLDCGGHPSDLALDPLFCADSTYSIRPDSPCAEANAGDCGQIGAVGVGCAAAARSE